jgi:hypothetical protein
MSMRAMLALKPLGSCAERARTYSKTLTKNMVTQRRASDQASHNAAWALVLPAPRPRCLASSVTTPLYSTSVSRALRAPLRGRARNERQRTPTFSESG